MKNTLAAITSWLKENKQEVTDEMVQTILISDNIATITLGFSSDVEISKFVMRVLPNSTAEKADGCYMLRVDWKKRPLVIIPKVIPNLPRRSAELFSDT